MAMLLKAYHLQSISKIYLCTSSSLEGVQKSETGENRYDLFLVFPFCGTFWTFMDSFQSRGIHLIGILESYGWTRLRFLSLGEMASGLEMYTSCADFLFQNTCLEL